MKNANHYTMMTALAAAVALASCTAVLPSSYNKTPSKWKTYDEAKAAFDTIVVGISTQENLNVLGFEPGNVPNIRILNYVDVVASFGSAFKLSDLPAGVQRCVKARDDCHAYIMKVQNINSQRDGNVAADLFGFGKHTHTTGWDMQVTLVLIDKTVVYKLWNGTPAIESYEKQSNPLGPMQNLGSIVPKPF